MIQCKRVYEPASPADGRRVLVDRLWPRGIRKEALAMDDWLKEVARPQPVHQYAPAIGGRRRFVYTLALDHRSTPWLR